MQRNQLSVIRDYIVKHCKIIFPIIVVIVVAATVIFALTYKPQPIVPPNDGSTVSGNGSMAENLAVGNGGPLNPEDIPEVPLQPNEDDAVYSLVAAYYNAQGTGDLETLRAIHDTISENDLQYYKALSEYIDHYAELQVNTKQGYEEGSVLAYIYYRLCFVNHEEGFPGYEVLYICKDENGELYIKNRGNLTEDEDMYIKTISNQADALEFTTRVSVEFDNFTREYPELTGYLSEVSNQVSIDQGVALANLNKTEGETDEGGEGQVGDDPATETPAPEESAVPEYATATTTVNVRNSDSEKADKLGRVPSGTRLKVQEVRVNGWTKVVYEGKDGFIKSEYLQFAESAASQEVIGTVTANTNINVRAAASQTAERLGMLAGGESLDLLAIEGDWCKVVFNGQVAYVKAEYVRQQ